VEEFGKAESVWKGGWPLYIKGAGAIKTYPNNNKQYLE